MAKTLRTKKRSAVPKAAPSQIDLWPDKFGQAPWLQGGVDACTAFAVGAAAYWLELKTHPRRDPGTPDFPFLYNNEAFVSSSIVNWFVQQEKGGSPQAPSAFRILAASRSAATFGVRFLPRGQDYEKEKYTFFPAPPYSDFVEARRHLFDFHLLFQAPQVDPNAPVVTPPLAQPRHLTVRQSLLDGLPVVMGYYIYSSMVISKEGHIAPLEAPRGQATGAHAVLLVGFDDATRRFRFRNSQGPAFGTGGYGTIPYAWVDDLNATFGFTTFTHPDRTQRPFVPFDDLRITNRSASAVSVNVDAYDGRQNYLGGQACSVDAGKSVLLHPVRWLSTFRLDVLVTPASPSTAVPRGLRLLVDDPNGAVASGAEIVVPRGAAALTGRFFGARGKAMRSTGAALIPAIRLEPAAPPGVPV